MNLSILTGSKKNTAIVAILSLNSKATKLLKEAGYEFGLFGTRRKNA